MIGSPLKKPRNSLSGNEEESLRTKFGLGLAAPQGDILGRIEQERTEEGKVEPVSQDRPLFGESLGSTVQHESTFGGQLGSGLSEKPVKAEEMEDEEL